MNQQKLSEQVSISGQIEIDDIAELARDGVEVLVCNRPDGESVDQTPYAEIEAAAKNAGMETFNIPFTGGSLTEAKVREFAEVIKTGKRLHAYCRTGNRCGIIFNASRELVPASHSDDQASAAQKKSP